MIPTDFPYYYKIVFTLLSICERYRIWYKIIGINVDAKKISAP